MCGGKAADGGGEGGGCETAAGAAGACGHSKGWNTGGGLLMGARCANCGWNGGAGVVVKPGDAAFVADTGESGCIGGWNAAGVAIANPGGAVVCAAWAVMAARWRLGIAWGGVVAATVVCWAHIGLYVAWVAIKLRAVLCVLWQRRWSR